MLHLYTGIGSRETPEAMLCQLSDIAQTLARAGYTLRSGAAEGADRAFEQGAQRVPTGSLEIYLPWKAFNDSTSLRFIVTDEAMALAASVHPHWPHLKDPVRRLHARNCYQVLGERLDSPSEFLICWTPDGCEAEGQRTRATGGSATAIVLADRHGIPVFNLQRKESAARLADFFKKRQLRFTSGIDAGFQASLF